MRKYILGAHSILGALLVIGLAGCSAERTDDTVSDPTPEQPMATDSAMPPAGPPPSTGTAAGEVALRTAAGAGGPYLTDATHRALYLLEGDADGGKCTGECLAAWPPVLVPTGGRATAAPELQADKVGTITRADGATQVTYNGRPLYRYAKDSGPGATTGQDIHDQWGGWYLVTPAGEALEEAEGNEQSNEAINK